jgi:hypothetical protein
MDVDVDSRKAACDGRAMGFYPGVPFPDNSTPRGINNWMQAAMPGCTNAREEIALIRLNSYRAARG